MCRAGWVVRAIHYLHYLHYLHYTYRPSACELRAVWLVLSLLTISITIYGLSESPPNENKMAGLDWPRNYEYGVPRQQNLRIRYPGEPVEKLKTRRHPDVPQGLSVEKLIDCHSLLLQIQSWPVKISRQAHYLGSIFIAEFDALANQYVGTYAFLGPNSTRVTWNSRRIIKSPERPRMVDRDMNKRESMWIEPWIAKPDSHSARLGVKFETSSMCLPR